MKILPSIVLAALLLATGTTSTTEAAISLTSNKVVSSRADLEAGKHYGQQYASEAAYNYGYQTGPYYTNIDNEYFYAEDQKTNASSPQPPDFWRGVQLGLYAN